MINSTFLLGILLAALLGTGAATERASAAPPAGAMPGPGGAVVAGDLQGSPVRVWVEENTDLFYPNDPVNLRFRVADDAYVAVIHLDTDGNLDLLFPFSAWDDEFVRGQRTYTIGGAGGRFTLGRAPGIGYFYAIASPYPLDLRFFRTRAGVWDGAGLGRVVRGDPFWTLEYLTQVLSPDWRLAPVAVDVFSYHAGGRHRYPSYACYDRFSRGAGSGAHAYYPSCDRLQRLLAGYPNYYDARRYRGDRGLWLREMDDLAPRHTLKEPVGRYAPSARDRDLLDRAVPRGSAPPPPVGQAREGTRSEPTAPARQRPTLERRPSTERDARPSSERESPQREPRREPPPPRESTPQRESPPPRESAPPPREREQTRPERRPPPEA